MRLLVVAIAGLLGTGCEGGETCTCFSGELCVDGVCRQPCNSTADCTDTGLTCRDGACVAPVCGNGLIESGETCDGNCPSTCGAGPACTEPLLLGESSTCTAVCTLTAVSDCDDGDDCCPAECGESQDDDCSPAGTCGDGNLDPLETCDLDCPTSCDDENACTSDLLVGSAANCSARCVYAPIAACAGGDGCCPAGCDPNSDSDCDCVRTPHDHRACSGGGVYWFDSCGVREELAQDCRGDPCVVDACVPACPSPWQNTDIGPVALTGSVVCSGSEFAITASGSDIWNTADEMHFVYQPLSGDGWIEARAVSNDAAAEWSKTGVMIRESLAPDAKHAHVLVSREASNPVKFDRRLTTGGTTTGHSGSQVAPPHWLRLARRGDVFSGYESTNGTAWTLLGTHTISMESGTVVGLTMTAHDNSVLATGVFDNVRVEATVPECFVDDDCGSGPCLSGNCEPQSSEIVLGDADIKAFPTAVGHGRIATGGRGQFVYFVTHLNDSGSGSLRDALSQSNRIVVFRVGGTIELTSSRIYVNGDNITIAGQTAPGDGIAVHGSYIDFSSDENIIIRHIRVRPGDSALNDNDGIRITSKFDTVDQTRFILDHVSLSWAADEVFSATGNVDNGAAVRNLTVQNSILSEGFGAKNVLLWHHTYNISFIRNLMANSSERNIRTSTATNSYEEINNVIHYTKAGLIATYENEFDVIGNVFSTGSQTPYDSAAINVNSCSVDNCPPDGSTTASLTRVYESDNIIEGHFSRVFETEIDSYRTSTRNVSSGYVPMAASAVKAAVLADVGARANLTDGNDTLDQHMIDDVVNNTGGFVSSESQTIGLPTLASGTPYPDSDSDGLSDAYEAANGGSVTPNERPATAVIGDGRTVDQSDVTNFAAEGYTHMDIFLADLAGDWDAY